jgi:hypothetical protein
MVEEVSVDHLVDDDYDDDQQAYPPVGYEVLPYPRQYLVSLVVSPS